jgi:hypothetical protein
MKKHIGISLIMVGIWFLVVCATFPKKSEPGLYVNGWPAFSISYPANWVEITPDAGQVFRAETSEGPPTLTVSVIPNMTMPLKYSSRVYIPVLAKIGRDIKVISDKESKLKDGTPTQETELEWVIDPGIKLNTLFLTTKKEDVWITISLTDTKGRIGEDLKQIAHSLKIEPGKEELVKVPAGIQEFLDQYSMDMVSHDLEKIMLHYSDQYLQNGARKAEVEAFIKRTILGITSFQVNITRFESQENKAYLAGFIRANVRKAPLSDSIIKENGQWKWFGNQRQKQM